VPRFEPTSFMGSLVYSSTRLFSRLCVYNWQLEIVDRIDDDDDDDDNDDDDLYRHVLKVTKYKRA